MQWETQRIAEIKLRIFHVRAIGAELGLTMDPKGRIWESEGQQLTTGEEVAETFCNEGFPGTVQQLVNTPA